MTDNKSKYSRLNDEVELMFVVVSNYVYIRDVSTLFHYARHRKTEQMYFPGANNCIYTIKIFFANAIKC